MTSTHNKEWRWIKKISRSWCCDRLLPLATKVNKDEHLKYPVGHEFWGWFVGINPRSSAKPIFRISSICTGKTKNQQTLKSMKYCSTPKKKVRFWWNQWMRFIDSTYFFCLLHYQENKVHQRQADKTWIQDWWIMVKHCETWWTWIG